MTSDEQLRKYLDQPEGLTIEFKEAKNRYDFEKLKNYCVALANEGGGKIILGVTDTRPRKVVGTKAFEEPGRTEAGLHRDLGHRIPIEELTHAGRRILIVHIPSRLPGAAWDNDGRFLKREGDDLRKLNDQELRKIFSETGPDFTAEPISSLSYSDLQTEAVSEFIKR
ncbi:ATP-binding protein, partial [bacterium]|nr:ATP-binding protein [bacterium]